MKKIIVASNNKGKIKEIKEKLEGLNYEILSLEDAEINIDIIENGNTYEENAYIKAKTISDLTGEICIGDDSGMEIDAIPGELGVHSHRFLGEGSSYDEKITEIFRRMKKLPFEKRKSKFTCIMILVFPNGEKEVFSGITNGYITEKRIGNNGFAFDPIFYVKEYNKTYAEMDMNFKNEVSHRGKALTKLKEYLEKN